MASALRRFELSIMSLHIERGYVLMAFTTVPAGQAGLLATYHSRPSRRNNLSELTVPTNGQGVAIVVPLARIGMHENFALLSLTELSDIGELIEGLLNDNILVSDGHLLFRAKGCCS
ncbi:hypothetical protein QNM99_22380 [Pseudomonas sp. PCH446]